ncbi:ABC transporter substrate-binding protein [Promethearchaeum syntrophicum]|uniref:ABC transporter substrate-binding protein n=1 Tax=Promethearchaeum syntrophicum TaxID=2594042 RepID=A0A5B9DG43_9ARCH|nr:ABC transporter substrate-binding protein [Candidatus Prometheoarchaeum syntrophicum]QEE17637.1 Bacterial extracellular solute-binding proteins, family 5 Middle [Candidatus Prometheoarchaeum syntrophicum]
MNKKRTMIFILLGVLLVAPSLFSIEATATAPKAQQTDDTLIVGQTRGPVDLDCVFAWDSASSATYDQCIEGLFQYDLTDPDLAIIPVLASADGEWLDNVTYEVPIRENVTFHDGMPFNASAAKWNFDRLAFFMNITGTLTEGLAVVQTSSLYEFPDGTPIINNTVADDVGKTLTFHLNSPFAAFQPLLCFGSSYIQSPHSTPAEDYVITANGTIYGTGPYVYGEFTADVEVTFTAFEDYWNPAGAAKIPNLVYKLVSDGPTLMQGLTAGDYHIQPDPLFQYLWDFYEDPWINVTNPGSNLRTAYLGMNTKLIPVDVRQAISYAFDYDYVIAEVYDGYADRLESPVPKGVLMSDYSSQEATTDIIKAREKMQAAGYGEDLELNDNSSWRRGDFLTFNYTYNTDNQIRADLFPVLKDTLEEIGIVVTDAGMIWDDFLYRLYDIEGYTRDMLELFWVGWIPDYNDPSNWLDPLLSTSGGSNGAQFSNATIDAMLADALVEINQTVRAEMYAEIQRILVEEQMPWVYGVNTQNWDCFRGVKGYPSNPMGKEYYAPVEFGTVPEDQWAIPIEPSSGIGIPGYTVTFIAIFSLAASLYLVKAIKKKSN